MSYSIYLYNSSGTKVAILTEKECDATVRRKINAEWTIDINYPIPPEGQGEDKSSYLSAFGAWARVANNDSSSDYSTFILGTPDISHGENGQVVLRVQGESFVLVTLSREIVTGVFDFKNVTPTTAMTRILNYSTVYTIGTITPTEKINLLISYKSVLSALQKILNATGAELDISESGATIGLSSSLGSTTKYINIRPGRNLKSIRLVNFNRDVTNCIYGVGNGIPPATIAGARHRIASINSQVITSDHNKLVPENDSWNTYRVRVETGTLAGSYFDIADCAYPNSLTLTGTLTGLAVGDKFSICSPSSTANVNFIRAATSITTYGQINSVLTNTSRGLATNEVKTADMSGTYTTGLCADWTKEGSPTLSEETSVDYVKYGSKSQKVIGVSDGDGISQVIPVTQGKIYLLSVWLHVTAGTVKTLLGTRQAGEPQAAGTDGAQRRMIQFFKAGGTSYTLKVVQSGATAATFYVDAVLLTETKYNGVQCEDRNFTPNDERTELWCDVFDEIMKTKDPKVEYFCNFVDLNKMSPNDYPFDNIVIGDTVIITDSEINISNVSSRVREINYNVFRPELTEHTVSNQE